MSGITHIHCLRCRCAIELTGDWFAADALMVACPTCHSETYLSLSLVTPEVAPKGRVGE
jgi:Zn finger protein HypA/HybF involved in hydrogenase expression